MIDIDKKFFFFYNNFDKGKLKMLHLKMSNSIKDYRKRNNETQEQTAEALDCCVNTISNIETEHNDNNNQNFYAKIIHHFNMPISQSNPVTQNQFDRFIIESKIHYKLDIGNFNVKELLNEYRNTELDMNNWEKQFFLFANAVVSINTDKNCNYEAVLKDLKEALSLSYKGDISNINSSNHNFYGLEYLILMNIAIVLSKIEKHDDSIYIFEYLYKNISKSNFDSEEYVTLFPTLSYYYAQELYSIAKTENYKETYKGIITIVQKAVDCLIDYGNMYLLEELFSLLADSYNQTGDIKLAEENREKSQILHSIHEL